MGWLGNLIALGAAPLTGGASLTPMLIGAGLGAAKHFAVDKPAAEASRKQAAAIMRHSPWTGMQAGPIKSSDLFGSVLGGAALGSIAGGAAAKAGEKTAEEAGKAAGKAAGASMEQAAAKVPMAGAGAASAPTVGGSMVPSLGYPTGVSANMQQMAATMPKEPSKFSFLGAMQPNIKTPYTGGMFNQQSASPWNYLARR